jgi:flagellar export protein FliJ
MAQAFKFRLETVRRIRRKELDLRRREVAKTTRDVLALQDRIDQLNETVRSSVGELRRSQSGAGSLELAQIRMHYVHQSYLARQMVDAELTLAEKQKDLSKQRATLKQANAKAKALEKLHERRKEQFDWDQRKNEQKIEDEQAQRIILRKQMEQSASAQVVLRRDE